MSREGAKEYLKDLRDRYWDSWDEDEMDIAMALDIAIADMDTLQDILDITRYVMDD